MKIYAQKVVPHMKYGILVILFISFSCFAAERDSDLTWDIGVSTGQVNKVSYSEASLGLNWYFLEWMAWRNAAFARFLSGESTIGGVDTSLRPIFHFGDNKLGLTTFFGPGYRFVSKGVNAPFGEAGLIAHIGQLSLGVGGKAIMNEWSNKRYENDTQIFIILAGSGSL